MKEAAKISRQRMKGTLARAGTRKLNVFVILWLSRGRWSIGCAATYVTRAQSACINKNGASNTKEACDRGGGNSRRAASKAP